MTGAVGRTPDVVVMDLEMPGGGGVAATAEILRQLPATRILVLTLMTTAGDAGVRAGALRPWSRSMARDAHGE